MINTQCLIDRVLGNYKNKRILIVGLSKTGTTGLYYRIKNSLPPNTPTYFEFCDFSTKEKIISHEISVTKLILDIALTPDIYDELPYPFNKIIFITRDPRDKLISALLYFGAFKYSEVENKNKVENVIDILNLKEAEPQKTPIIDIVKKMDDTLFKDITQEWEDYTKTSIKFTQEQNCFIFRYEDFVNDDVSELEKYLGFKLWGKSKVDNKLNRVVRTKNSGSWRNWFTQEDITYFKPLLSEYMTYFNYDNTDWKLNKNPVISPEHCSKYFRRVINEKAKNIGLKY